MKTVSNNKSERLILGLLILLVLGAIVTVLFSWEKRKDNNDANKYQDDYSDHVVYNDKNYYQNRDLEVIMVVGLDSYELKINEGDYMNDALADFIVLLALDKEHKTIQPVQINRDTMANYNELGLGNRIISKKYGQIALSHSYGSGGLDSLANTKNSVSDLCLNLDIEDSLSLAMGAVEIINDAVGGVDVYVEDDFSAIDPSIIQGQVNTLTGKQALTFVRARSDMKEPTNTSRMERQRAYLKAFVSKAKTVDSNTITTALKDVSNYMVSNLNITGLTDLGNILLDCQVLDAITIDGEFKTDSGYMEFYPNEADLTEKILSVFFIEK